MTVTLRELQEQITVRLADPAPLERPDSCQALGHAGRLLHRLAADGLLSELPNPRESAVHALADACTSVGDLDPGGPHRRVGELMGATADLAYLFQEHAGREARWALALEVAGNVRRIMHHPTRDDQDSVAYYAAPALRRVLTAAVQVERLGAQGPPDPTRTAVLDRQLPYPSLPPGLTADEVIGAAAAGLLHYSSGDRRAELSVAQVQLVCKAAESVCDYASTLARTAEPDDAGRPWRAAEGSWRTVREELGRLRDGARGPGLPPPVAVWAIRLHEAAQRASSDLPHHSHVPTAGIESAMRVLPEVAANVQTAIGIWQKPGRVIIDVHQVDPAVQAEWSERVRLARLSPLLARTPPKSIAWVESTDLTATLDAVGQAQDMSAHLSEELGIVLTQPDARQRQRRQVQPGTTAAALTHDNTTTGSGLDGVTQHPEPAPVKGTAVVPDAAQRWEPVVRAVGGNELIDDPGWPALAAGLHRADLVGWDVVTNLPRLVYKEALPARYPARELHYRLMADCDAAQPARPLSVNPGEPTHHVARHHADLPMRPEPTVGRPDGMGR